MCLVGDSHNYECRPKACSAISLMGWRSDMTFVKIGQRTLKKGEGRSDLTTSTESREGVLTSLRGEQKTVWTFVGVSPGVRWREILITLW